MFSRGATTQMNVVIKSFAPNLPPTNIKGFAPNLPPTNIISGFVVILPPTN